MNSEALKYKGFIGSVEFSLEDQCLFGEVLNTPSALLLYEGDTLAELEASFRYIVDDYLGALLARGESDPVAAALAPKPRERKKHH